jgi:hypothetical protein
MTKPRVTSVTGAERVLAVEFQATVEALREAEFVRLIPCCRRHASLRVPFFEVQVAAELRQDLVQPSTDTMGEFHQAQNENAT